MEALIRAVIKYYFHKSTETALNTMLFILAGVATQAMSRKTPSTVGLGEPS